jgi:NTE family protein
MTQHRRSLLTCLAVAILLSACGSTKPPAVIQPTVALPAKPLRPIKIGLALGGGAARGFAHIGVIKILEAQGIVPDIVVGTSAGSVVGAMYAAGNNGFALQRLALEMDEASISDWAVPLFSKATGVLKGEALQNYVNKVVHDVPLEKLKIPFGAVATDLKTGAPILFRRGNTGIAVRASSSVPSVFQPVRIGGRSYVDGGLVAPVPVKFAREMGADFVIAVNISSQPETQAAASSLDVVLQPQLGAMKGADFNGRNLAILAGEQVTLEAIREIKEKLRLKREAAQ